LAVNTTKLADPPSLATIQARIKDLPALPLAAHKLVLLMQQQNCSAADVTGVLSSDQALAGKVLKLANSSFYGLSGKVVSISRAVVVLGFSTIRSMALGLGMAQSVKKVAGKLDLEAYWRHALYVAAAARVLAQENGRVDSEEVFVSGLMHDIGHLILEMAVPDLPRQLADVPIEERLDAETRIAGMPHTKAGQMVMRHWKLPGALARMTRFHHHPTAFREETTSLAAFVQLADLMARSLGQSQEPATAGTDPVELAQHLGISLRDTLDLLTRTCQEVDRARSFLDVAGVSIELEDPLMHHDPSALSCNGTGVYLGTDADRAAWVNGQMAIHGWDTMIMRAFLAGDVGDVDLAVIDPRCISLGQAAKLKSILDERGVRAVILGSGHELTATFSGHAVLPMAFTYDDLAALRRGVPV